MKEITSIDDLPQEVKDELAFDLETRGVVCGHIVNCKTFDVYKLALVDRVGFEVQFVSVYHNKEDGKCRHESATLYSSELCKVLADVWKKEEIMRKNMLPSTSTQKEVVA